MIKNHTMKEILSHPFFNEDLEASWTNTVDAEENPRLHIFAHTILTIFIYLLKYLRNYISCL